MKAFKNTTKTTNETKREAISYGRFSSEAQTEGDSVNRQREAFEATCERYKVQGSTRYEFGSFFGKGESAFHGAHLAEGGSLRGFLNLLKSGTIDPTTTVLVIEMWSRFSRTEPAESLALLQEIVKTGCVLAVYSPDMWVTRESLGTVQFVIIGMLLQMAHEESKQKSRIGKVNRERIRTTGKTKDGKKPKNCPRWLKVAEDGKGEKNAEGAHTGYEKNQPFWDTLKAACLMSINGNGASIIGARLGLSPNGLVATFRERSLIGEFQPRIRDEQRSKAGEAVEGYYPALLSVDEFRQLQAALDSRKQKGGSGKRSNPVTNLFTGLVFNSDGCEMVIKAQRRNALKPYGVPADWKRAEGEKGNGKRWLPGKELHYDVFESAVLDVFAGLSAEQLYPKDTNEEAKQLRELSARIQDLDSKREGWEIEALESGSPALSRMIVAAETKVNALKAEYEALEVKLSANKADTLPATQSLITELMEGKEGQELLDMRAKLKGMLSLSIARITVEVHGTKSAGITVQLRNGSEVRTGEFTKVGKLSVAMREIA